MKLKLPFKLGNFWIVRDKGQALRAGSILQSHLFAVHFRGSKQVKVYDLGSGVVTNAGVYLLAADWNNGSATLKLANYHDSGTGVTTPTINDVALQTPTGNARSAGAQSTSLNIYTTAASLGYSVSANITEWGLFTDPATGTLWDHRTFVAIPVVTGDTIYFQYSLTIASGG